MKRQPKRLRLVTSPHQIARVAAALAYVSLDWNERQKFCSTAERLIEHLALVAPS